MTKISGGELIALFLKKEGVDIVFGIIDGSYLGLNFGLRKQGIRLITPRHEACAVHMAGAYARLTGKLGVCLASSGPGVANALPGVIVEHAEGNRVLLITSSRRTGVSHPERIGAYQYFDQSAVIQPTAKASLNIPAYDRIPEFMKRGFRAAFGGKPGVVHVNIPENIINGKAHPPIIAAPETYRRVEPLTASNSQIDKVAERLALAKHPLIHAGSGVIHALAFNELFAVADLLKCPITTSWGARAAITENSYLALPMPYVELVGKARNEADVLLVIGSRIGETDWWGKAPNWAQSPAQYTIQVDIDEQILGLNKPIQLAVQADARSFLTSLYHALLRYKDRIPFEQRHVMLQQYESERKKQRLELDKRLEDQSDPILTAHIPQICRSVFPDDAITVLDGGNSTIWGSFYHEVKTPNTLLMTAKFGMLGAGIPQALGAAAAYPHRQVYCIIGDGAMGFNLQELETAVRNRLRVVFLVCCDKQWGMVKMTQQFALAPWRTLIFKTLPPGETMNTDLSEIRFDKIAEAVGAHGERVSSVNQLKPAILRAIEVNTSSVIHIDVDPVKHLWAPNLMTFKRMHQEPAGR